MRSFWVWSVVFLSGFLAGVIISPVLLGGAPAGLPAYTAEANAESAPLPVAAEPLVSPSQSAKRDEDAYRAVALNTLGKVRSSMKDPQSVQFRNLLIVHVSDGGLTPEASAVCGEINGRNSFGAYAGFIPFIAADDFLMTADDSSFGTLFAENCNPSQIVAPLVY